MYYVVFLCFSLGFLNLSILHYFFHIQNKSNFLTLLKNKKNKYIKYNK